MESLMVMSQLQNIHNLDPNLDLQKGVFGDGVLSTTLQEDAALIVNLS